MKKFLILAVVTVLVVGNTSGKGICKVDPMISVHLEKKSFKNATCVLSKKYPKSHLERFITLAHLIEDLDINNIHRPIPLSLHGVSVKGFEWLLQAAAPNAKKKDRELPEDLNDLERLVALYKLAIFLDPVDKKTLYPMTLYVLLRIGNLSQEGTPDDNPRINFLKNTFKATDVVEMLNNFITLFVDDTYKEDVGTEFKVIRDTEYLRNSLTNQQVQRMILYSKDKAVQASDKPKLIERITVYLNSLGLSPKQFLVPGPDNKPIVGAFPISVQDLINTKLMPQIDEYNVLNLSYEGLTSVQGLRNVPGITTVQILYFAENNLKELPEKVFAGMSSVQIINLRENQLQTLPEKLFVGLNSLRRIDLDKNQLKELPEKAFTGLGSLAIINLDNNQLAQLPEEIFSSLENLVTLDLHNNQLTITEQELRDQNPGLPASCRISLYDQQPQQSWQ